MRTIERSSAFKRDYKRVKATPRHAKDIDDLLTAVLSTLLVDEPLSVHHRDHELTGNWTGYREQYIGHPLSGHKPRRMPKSDKQPELHHDPSPFRARQLGRHRLVSLRFPLRAPDVFVRSIKLLGWVEDLRGSVSDQIGLKSTLYLGDHHVR